MLRHFIKIRSTSFRKLFRENKILYKFSQNRKNTSSGYESVGSVIIEKMDKIMLIGINRPEKKNYLNLETALKLKKAFTDFENDSAINVAILHGIGGSFCSGFELSEASSTDDSSEEVDTHLGDKLGFMGPARIGYTKPVIGSISGYAIDGGLELALLCDLRVMEDTAVMGFFCRRFGVPLIDGGTVRLPKIIGLSRALDLILTGRPIQGKEAFEFGLANRLVPCGTALGQSIQLANCIAKYPQKGLQADKRSTFYGVYKSKSLEDALDFELKQGLHVINEEGKTSL